MKELGLGVSKVDWTMTFDFVVQVLLENEENNLLEGLGLRVED